jgi:hypothetical protein
MAKKALVSTVEPKGKDVRGYRVAQVVEANETFEVYTDFEWKDCPNHVEQDMYWYDPVTESYKKTPESTDQPDESELAVDENNYVIEQFVWDWDAEAWTTEALTL